MNPEDATPRPFVVSLVSWQELLRSPADRRKKLEAEWRHWRARSQVLHPETFESVPHPTFTQMPEDLRWPRSGQMVLPGLGQAWETEERLGPFQDAGDRQLIREALLYELPAILTTDLKTFWRHRTWLYSHGLEVWRPTDLCWALLNDLLLFNGEGIDPAWPSREVLASREKEVERQASLAG